MGADSPPSPHAPPRPEGYRFVHKTPLWVVLLTLAITGRGSLFGMGQSFVMPSLLCVGMLLFCLLFLLAAAGQNGGSKPPPYIKTRNFRHILMGADHVRRSQRYPIPQTSALLMLRSAAPEAITGRGSLFDMCRALLCPLCFAWVCCFVCCFCLWLRVKTAGVMPTQSHTPPPYIKTRNFRPCQ